jgi:selenium metabolism protein YedF
MKKTIDLRAAACPDPVVETRRAMGRRGTNEITVILDNDASCDHVTRMARNEGWEVQVDDRGMGEFIVTLKRSGGGSGPAEVSGPEPSTDASADGSILPVLVESDGIGGGSEELGRMLMRAFVGSLREASPGPTHLIFMNRGVFLTTEGSLLLGDLKELESEGVSVLSCQTCLDYFKLMDGLRVGRAADMTEIVSLLLSSSRPFKI